MAPGAPRDKRKVARGGGKKFSRGMRETGGDLDISEVPSSIVTGSDAEPSAEEESGSESDSGAGASSEPLSRAERKAAAKARKEVAAARAKAAGGASDAESGSDDDAPVNVIKKGVAGMKVSNPNDPVNARAGPSRREREAMEAQAAKERYWKLQMAGKTDQAKADLARLAKIRAEREAAAAARKAEMEEKKQAAEKKAAEKGGRR